MKNKRKLSIIIVFVILTLNSFMLSDINSKRIANFSNYSTKNGDQQRPNTSGSTSYTNVEWLKNTNFSSPSIDPWFNRTEGDPPDLMASNSTGQADFLVLGEDRYYSLEADFSKPSDWTAQYNPYHVAFPEFPETRGVGGQDKYNITSWGFWAQHQWQEGPRQNPSIQWVQHIEMPVDMSDYNITSASVFAQCNGSVDRNIDSIHPDDEPEGVIVDPKQGDVYDYVRFYVKLAKPNYDPYIEPPTEIAWNQTRDLGLANGIDYLVMENTSMITLPEKELIEALNTVFSKDYKNFTVIIGMDIHCEDNCASDEDDWDSLNINKFSLNFNYTKTINQFSSVSWNQKGAQINHTDIPYYSHVRIDDAKLNFKYKINQTWTPKSYSSELRFLINNKTQTRYPYIKLRSYNNTKLQGNFTEAISGFYDVKDLILVEKNISLTIQLLILDTFNLGNFINISIDDVLFNISYTVFIIPPPPPPADSGGGSGKTTTTIFEEPWFHLLIAIGAIAGGACLAGYLVAYQLVLKYPKPVRKVRKYRKTLKRKQAPDLEIWDRNKAFKELYDKRSVSGLVKVKGTKKLATSEKIIPESAKKILNSNK